MNDKMERDVALVPARIGRDKQRHAEGTNIRLTAGCLCIGPDQKILLVASMSKPNDWTLPKGGWESDEMEEECAKREALEEGGVVGDIVTHIGTYQNVNPRSLNETRLSLYLMNVTLVLDDWAEGAVRQRRWVTLDEALTIVDRPGHTDALRWYRERNRLATKP